MKDFECARKYLSTTCRMFGVEHDTILKLDILMQGHTAGCITTSQLNFVKVRPNLSTFMPANDSWRDTYYQAEILRIRSLRWLLLGP